MYSRKGGGDLDSLAEDSIQKQVYYQDQMEYGNDGNGGNGYDFLIDDEYQNLKAKEERLNIEKWQIMGQKVTLAMILTELHSSLVQQHKTLTQQHQSEVHRKSGSLKDLRLDVKSQMELNSRQIQMVMKELQSEKSERRALQDQNSALEHQISRLLESSRNRQGQKSEQDFYITELENQLQDTRKQLLEKKLKLADREDECHNLLKQVQSLEAEYRKLEEEKRDLDELVIKVSQEMKSKEYELRYYNYQVANEKDLLNRQIDLLKKELQEEKERKSRLEILESDLIHKADVKDQENQQLKQYLQDLEEKFQFKSDAIEKAQRVIERLNEEFDKVTQQLQSTEAERDQLRQKLRESSKRVLELNKQIHTLQTQHQASQQHVSQVMKTEIDELKEAIKQYQQQFDEEKRTLAMSLREASEDKYKLHIEKERIEQQLRKQLQSIQQQADQEKIEMQQKLKQMEKQHQEELDSLKHLLTNKEDQAQSQIKYLHKRLQEVQNNPKSASTTGSKAAYLQTLKKEFEVVAQELLDIRQLLKQQSQDQYVGGIQYRIRGFEDFRVKVLKCLDEWEVKAEGLSQLSQRYERELEEQKKIFIGMRQMLKEKDILISNIQRQARHRDQAQDAYINTLRRELERQSYIVRNELLDQFQATQKAAQSVNEENHDLNHRFQAFKQDYMQLLEDKDQIQQQSLTLQSQIEAFSRDISYLSNEQQTFLTKLSQLLNSSSSTLRISGISHGDNGLRPSQLLQSVEQVMDELRVRRDEVLSYKAQVQTLREQAESDKEFLQTKVQAVEDQLMMIQRQNLSKEEEQHVTFLQKETKYINELERCRQELNSASQQLSTRERQLKKAQQTCDDKEDQIQSLTAEIQTLQTQVQQLQSELSDRQSRINDMVIELSHKEQQLQDLTRDRNDMESLVKRTEERQKCLKDQLLERDIELQRERELNLQLQDEKYQAVNLCEQAVDKSQIFERENQNLYRDLVLTREQMRDQQLLLDESERQKRDLERACEQMTEVVAQVQDEVVQSQRHVEQLNTALDKMKKKHLKAKDLKMQLRLMRANEQQMTVTIDSLRRQLHPQTSTCSVQTDPASLHELVGLHPDFQLYKQQIIAIQRDNEMLQESLGQRAVEIDRLISEKRDLEELVDQQNQSIKQIRLNTTNAKSMAVGSTYKENLNLLNSQRESDLYSRILQEKENYIMRLEQEIGDMRRETEQLKDKLIGYEIGNLSMETRSLGKSHQQSVGKPFKNQTQQSMQLNATNLYNQTQATSVGNYNTIQGTVMEEYKSLNRSIH